MGRKIYILRHGERCDKIRNNYPILGEGFLELAFGNVGIYKAYDVNMPETLPERSDGWRAYGFDPPLTLKGLSSAELTGSLFHEKQIDIDFIYSSPALRCVQTANEFVTGYGKALKIRIEPGLFEWLEWFKTDIPTWIPPSEYKTLGYSVDVDYTPIVPVADLFPAERLDQFYDRSQKVMDSITANNKNENILIVGHVGNMETCTRSLLRTERHSREKYCKVTANMEYLRCKELELLESGNYEDHGSPIANIVDRE